MTDHVWTADEHHTLPALLDRRLETDPDGPYLDVTGTTLTAAELSRAAGRVTGTLRDLGVRPGDRVATLFENGPEALLTWWGTVLGGAISVPVNSAYKGDYLTHQLTDAACSVLFAQGDFASRVAEIAGDCETLAHVVVAGPADAEVAGALSHSWGDVLAHDPDEPYRDVKPSDLGTFIYTGGTTGPSKGCMLSHNYHAALSRQIATCWRRTADDVVWTPLPLYHYNAICTAVVGALLIGGSSAISGRFSVSGFWPDVTRTRATIAVLLGTMAYLLAHDEDRPEMPRSGAAAANTRLRLLAAAPMPVEIDNRLRDRFCLQTFSGAYGVTEASLVSWTPLGVDNEPNAAGVVNSDYFDVRIFDDDDNELPRGSDGEIVLRPKRPHVMFEGYWGRPEATVETSRNWWYHTGDIGRIDEGGYLFFVDRKADYLRRRGENISSFEVERILVKHDAIADVAVHAVPSDLTEDDLKITATLAPGASLDEEALFRWCVEALPYFALPRYIEFRAELPRSPVGRVLKRTLREEGVTRGTWDVEAGGITYDRR